MYSVGRLTRIYETRTYAYMRVYDFGDYRQQPALPVLYRINPLLFVQPCQLSRRAAPRRAARCRRPRVASSARSNPIIHVLRFVRSNSVCLIIRTARLFPTRATVCFNTACSYARIQVTASDTRDLYR